MCGATAGRRGTLFPSVRGGGQDRAVSEHESSEAEQGRVALALLLERALDAAPELPGDIAGAQAAVRRMSLVEAAALHGRALFAPGSLGPDALVALAWERASFFERLGAALGTSERVVHAAVRARRFPLEPPRALAGYEYLGVFLSEGQLAVCDPCYHGRRSRMGGSFDLSHALEGAAGRWHAFVRPGLGEWADWTGELAVIHESGFEAAATEHVANIGVDGGTAGVFDRECPACPAESLVVEGVVFGRGAFSRSGLGDGLYPAFVARVAGAVVKVRIPYFEDELQMRDGTLPRRTSRRYAASAAFAVGDELEHVKFGVGTVVGSADGKIEVAFVDAVRTLVHARRA